MSPWGPRSENRKIKEHPKTVVKRARRAQTRLIRTRRGETDHCASFWPMLKKSIFWEQNVVFFIFIYFLLIIFSKDRKPYFSLFERQKPKFFLVRKTENPIFPYSKDRKPSFSLFERPKPLFFGPIFLTTQNVVLGP